MAREITQRTLRNDSGEIMRGLDRGESYVVTRNGVPVGELTPIRRRRFVSAEALRKVLAGAPRLDPARFRKDIDRVTDHVMSRSIYFFDPDGNRLEIFCDMMPGEAKQWLHENGGVAKPLALEEAVTA